MNFENIKSEQPIALLEVLVMFVLPIVLIQTGIISRDYRIQLYGGVYAFVIPLALAHRLTLHDFSLRFDNIGKASRLFGVEAILLLAGGFIVAFVLQYRIQTGVGRIVNPLQYLFVSVPVQQAVFFGFLYNRLTVITDNQIVIALMLAILFSTSHLPWDNVEFVVITFVMGIMWSSIYVVTPNLFWTMALHTIIGLFSLVIVQLN